MKSTNIKIKNKVLNRILKINNLTLEQFAKHLDVSLDYIKKITSTGVITKNMVTKMANFYLVPVDNFTDILTSGEISSDFITKINDKNEERKKIYLLENFNNINKLEDRITVYKLLEVFNIKKELQENKDNLKNDFDIFNYQKQEQDYKTYINDIIEYLNNLLK